MKRLLPALCVLVALSVSAIGGEIDTPGKTSPPSPPCTENCTTTASTGSTSTPGTLDATTLDLVLVMLGIIVP